MGGPESVYASQSAPSKEWVLWGENYSEHSYHGALPALPHDCLPTLEPGTRSQISTRFMARGNAIPRAHQEGAPRAGGRSPYPSGDVCAAPLRLEVLWKPEAFPLRGLGRPRTERVWGVASVPRSGPGELLLAVFFRFGWTRICTTPVSLHRVKIIGFWGKEQQQAIMQAVVSYMYYIFALLLSLS